MAIGGTDLRDRAGAKIGWGESGTEPFQLPGGNVFDLPDVDPVGFEPGCETDAQVGLILLGSPQKIRPVEIGERAREILPRNRRAVEAGSPGS